MEGWRRFPPGQLRTPEFSLPTRTVNLQPGKFSQRKPKITGKKNAAVVGAWLFRMEFVESAKPEDHDRFWDYFRAGLAVTVISGRVRGAGLGEVTGHIAS